MKTELLISCDEWENRVAVLEQGSLAEIYFEREEKVIGSIYKGRVENVLPGMGACFVNIGLGRNAFLYVDDILRDPINIGETEITDRRKGHTVSELLKVGNEVLVQIIKEPRGLKGARVSTNVSLPGRYLVLMPTGRYSGVSAKIEDEQERNRLKQIMRDIRPEGMATIVRTAAHGVSKAELIADLGLQVRLWHGLLESYKRVAAPALLHKDLNLVFKAVRDFVTSDVEQVFIDSREQFEEIRSTMSIMGPQYMERLRLWEGPGNLFQVRGIDDELQKLLKPKIMLPSGGYLVLEHTEALTVIDVNTGKFTGGRNLEDTIVRTNIEGAAEVARQVRLRDIGGIIVVDFIDMAHERSRHQVIDTLTEALKRDRTRSTIQVFSNLGLLEFTRKRVGKNLAGQLRSECPYCSGQGDVMSSESLAIGLLRQIRQRGLDKEPSKKLDVITDPSVATQLQGWYREEFEKIGTAFNFTLQLVVEPHRHRENISLQPAKKTRAPLTSDQEFEVELLPVRLPDPSYGVAVIDGLLTGVKDAANAAGQTVKIKLTAVSPNFAQGELAEPMRTSQRRRRKPRGRVKGIEGDAPIAPPVPAAAAASSRPDTRPQERPAAHAPQPRRPSDLPFGFDEEEDDDFPASRIVKVPDSAQPIRAAQTRDAGRRRDGDRNGRGGRGRNRDFRRDDQTPPPLVVGGEGDIDYEDDNDDAIVVIPGAAQEQPLRPRREASASYPARDADAEHSLDDDAANQRRRRRRGRGRGRSEYVDNADDAGVQESRSVSGLRETRPQRKEPYRGAPAGERREPTPLKSDEDRYGDPAERRPRERQHKVYGPVRQLYGPPVTVDEVEIPAPLREPDESADIDELEVVIDPREPARLRVDFEPPPVRRAEHVRPPRPERESPLPAQRERRPARGSAAREPMQAEPLETPAPRSEAPPEERRPRGGPRPERAAGGERGQDAGRGRGGSGRDRGRRSSAGTGSQASVRQVYPPPEMAEEPKAHAGHTNAPLSNKRAPRGPMMRGPGAPPPPKGKVRQLYPPPPDFAGKERPQSGIDADMQAATQPRDPDGYEENSSSMFVNDAQEIQDRRRRARERIEAREPKAEPFDAHIEE